MTIVMKTVYSHFDTPPILKERGKFDFKFETRYRFSAVKLVQVFETVLDSQFLGKLFNIGWKTWADVILSGIAITKFQGRKLSFVSNNCLQLPLDSNKNPEGHC